VRFLLPALLSAPQYNTLLLGLLCHQEQPPNFGKRIRRDLNPDIPPPDQLLRQTVMESEDGVADAIHMPPGDKPSNGLARVEKRPTRSIPSPANIEPDPAQPNKP